MAQTIESNTEQMVQHDVSVEKDVIDQIDNSQSNKNNIEHETKGFVDTVKEKATEAYHFVAGDEDHKGLVGTVKEKAVEVYHYVADKVSEAKHSVAGNNSKETPKTSTQSNDPTNDVVPVQINEKKDDEKDK